MSIENLRITWDEADDQSVIDGAQWYVKAHVEAERLARAHNISVAHACGIIAALSPALLWEQNIPAAWELCTTGDYTHPYGRANVTKAARIFAGEHPDDILGGPKVTAFYRAILSPQVNSAPVVDRHIINAWLGYRTTEAEQKRIMHNKTTIRQIQADIVELASELGFTNHVVQAILWVTARGWSRDRVEGQTYFV